MSNYQPQNRGNATRVSSCGNFIYTADGRKFKRTVLPSVAEPRKDEVDIEAGLAEFDAMRTKEIDAD